MTEITDPIVPLVPKLLLLHLEEVRTLGGRLEWIITYIPEGGGSQIWDITTERPLLQDLRREFECPVFIEA